MRDIYLHGALGAKFGNHFRFSVTSVSEVFDALRANLPGFNSAIRDGFYRIVLGKTKSSGTALREDQLVGLNIGNRAMHIVPVAAGRKNGGLSKVVAGIALVGLSAATFGATSGLAAQTLWSGGATLGGMAGNLGVGLMVSGVATMIAPEQKAENTQKSFTMSGPTSDMKEGAIIPIVYGEVVTGGYMISGAVEINGPSGDRSTSGGNVIRDIAGAIGGSANNGPSSGDR